jgi:hypothetical protein
MTLWSLVAARSCRKRGTKFDVCRRGAPRPTLGARLAWSPASCVLSSCVESEPFCCIGWTAGLLMRGRQGAPLLSVGSTFV